MEIAYGTHAVGSKENLKFKCFKAGQIGRMTFDKFVSCKVYCNAERHSPSLASSSSSLLLVREVFFTRKDLGISQ